MALSRIVLGGRTGNVEYEMGLAKAARKCGVKPHILERHKPYRSAELRKHFSEFNRLLAGSGNSFIGGDFDKALEQAKRSIEELHSAYTGRHKEIDRRMETTHQDILDRYPDLKKRDVLTYLVVLGGNHEFLVRR